jgi:hypothetical protein
VIGQTQGKLRLASAVLASLWVLVAPQRNIFDCQHLNLGCIFESTFAVLFVLMGSSWFKMEANGDRIDQKSIKIKMAWKKNESKPMR